ncbi:DUF5988 family protein [Micromonospora sp. CPCC 206060]|uniref:DUF5988 family protein n=1 Tax=Micromonospora sp. CPCC 206060 TaxID=3122406 RepID=UPI002FF300D8
MPESSSFSSSAPTSTLLAPPRAGQLGANRPADQVAAARRIDGVSVVLEGGPAGLPRTLVVTAPLAAEGRLRISHHGGYEHFERVFTPGGRSNVFRWTSRTKIAE